MNDWRERVNMLSPYVPGEQPKDTKQIKLNTNENPYPPSPKVIEAIKQANLEALRLYPDPECTKLREVYAKELGVKKENVFVGNGSDEVLAIAFQTFFMGKENVLIPDITYSFYSVYCQLYQVKPTYIPVQEDYTIKVEDYFVDHNGIVIANPNAPTSLMLTRKEIEQMVKRNPDKVVIVDEAYIDFGGETMIPLVDQYTNLLVVRTLSKSYSLAGMRVGFAIGSQELIEGMNRVKNSFNSYPVDRIAQIAAKEAIEDKDYFNQTRQKIIRTREKVTIQLEKLGFEVMNSKTNFLFISDKRGKAEEMVSYLKENHILVRYFKKPRLEQRIRVTIGTEEQMEQFLKCLEQFFLKGGKNNERSNL